MSSLLLEHKADANHQARNGLAPMHLCAQEDKVQVAQILIKHGAETESVTKAGYTPLHVASHFGQSNMVRFLVQQNGANVNCSNAIGTFKLILTSLPKYVVGSMDDAFCYLYKQSHL